MPFHQRHFVATVVRNYKNKTSFSAILYSSYHHKFLHLPYLFLWTFGWSARDSRSRISFLQLQSVTTLNMNPNVCIHHTRVKFIWIVSLACQKKHQRRHSFSLLYSFLFGENCNNYPFPAQGVPHWRVKSSGVRQSKIYKCPECSFSS